MGVQASRHNSWILDSVSFPEKWVEQYICGNEVDLEVCGTNWFKGDCQKIHLRICLNIIRLKICQKILSKTSSIILPKVSSKKFKCNGEKREKSNNKKQRVTKQKDTKQKEIPKVNHRREIFLLCSDGFSSDCGFWLGWTKQDLLDLGAEP